MRIETRIGAAVVPHVADVAGLRIRVFRDYPYLYDGDEAYERDYLATYARSPESLFVLAFDGETLVGASTGVPLANEVDAFRRPFVDAGIAADRVFYFGESVLLSAYRGRGLGHRFFDAREDYARALGRFDYTAFCSVVRDDDDPRRPSDHRMLDAFWRQRGYERRADMVAHIAWKEIGETSASEKPLAFWLKALA